MNHKILDQKIQFLKPTLIALKHLPQVRESTTFMLLSGLKELALNHLKVHGIIKCLELEGAT